MSRRDGEVFFFGTAMIVSDAAGKLGYLAKIPAAGNLHGAGEQGNRI
jgi:hypothetical protein